MALDLEPGAGRTAPGPPGDTAASRNLPPAAELPFAVHREPARIAALDGIRGLAILLVLAFHYGSSARGFGFEGYLLDVSQIGWVGVDLFFVLSGFLITGILYDSRGSNHYFRNFYIRRTLRIAPLYYTALLFVILLTAAWPESGFGGEVSPLWIAFYLTNVAMGLYGPFAAGILAHYWSLAIEEHFYLVWPFVAAWGSRQRLMAVACGVMILAFVLRLAFVYWGARGEYIYFLTPLRMDALAAGALAALAVRGPGGLAAVARPARLLALAAGACLLAIMIWRGTLSADDRLMQSAGYTLIAVGFAAGLIAALTASRVSSVLASPILGFFGRYSYGIYVWHPIVNMLLFHAAVTTVLGIDSPWESALYLAFALAVAILVALASYHGLEKPFLDLKTRFAPDHKQRVSAEAPSLAVRAGTAQ